MTSKKHTRYTLLLDEGVYPKESFPNLNNLYVLKHINHDFKKSGTPDSRIYKLAQKNNSLVVVYNIKDFRPLIAPNKPSVISLSTNLTIKQIDKKICKVLKTLKPSQTKGHLISITNEGIQSVTNFVRGSNN